MKSLSFYLYIFLLLITLTSVGYSQRALKLSVSVDGETKHVSYVSKNGAVYTSAKELALVLSGNYYYSPESAKLELKFPNYTLKFTARNQFVILTSKSTKEKYVYQLPVSTMLFKGDVYIPAKYSMFYINLAAEKEILFDDVKKHLTVTDNPINTITALTRPNVVSTKDNKVAPTPTKTPEAINSKYDIYGLEVSEKTNGTLIRIKSKKQMPKYPSSIKDDKLYLFLSGVSVKPGLEKEAKPEGLIKSIYRRQVSGNVQFEFDLKQGYSVHETFNDDQSNDLFITIHNEKLKTTTTDITDDKAKWLFDTIVIDPGHGGKDPGAIGVGKVKEKDINLDVGLKLGEIIKKKMPGVKVIYTRDDDTFIELYKRGKIANEADGKLFISLHCNSLAKKPSPASGFEVYLLRPGRTKEAIAIAEFENNVIQYEDKPDRYQKLTDENFILVSMAHSSYMRYSEKFSDILNKTWKSNVKIPSRGIKQAGFFVLVGASMPSVLVEMGFLSNREDEKYLNSSRGQSEIANAIFDSVFEYRKFYNETMQDGG